MESVVKTSGLLGAVVAIGFYFSAISVFALQLTGKPLSVYWIGLGELFLAIPLVYLLYKAPALHRPTLYCAQIRLMLAWLLLSLFLTIGFQIEFRKVRWMVVGHVTLFFAAFGGLSGILAQAVADGKLLMPAIFGDGRAGFC